MFNAQTVYNKCTSIINNVGFCSKLLKVIKCYYKYNTKASCNYPSSNTIDESHPTQNPKMVFESEILIFAYLQKDRTYLQMMFHPVTYFLHAKIKFYPVS